MRIVIETVPHAEQRYETVGDWFAAPDNTVHIHVSTLGHYEMEAVVAIHELIEMLLCRHRGITEQSVDKFDKEYEADRLEGDISEPGDSLDAPYRKEHCFATGIERLLISELDIDWKEYDDAINAL